MRRSAAALVLATGCQGFPCTDDVHHVDEVDRTMIVFNPSRRWPEGRYRIDVAIDDLQVACDLRIPSTPANTNCTAPLGFDSPDQDFPDDPIIPRSLIIADSLAEERVILTVRRDDVVVIDETFTTFDRRDHEREEGRKICAEWTTVELLVPPPS